MAENNNDIYGYQPLWGNWYIEMPIGRGSFGSVYKITREEMGHKYTSAVKMISIPSEDQYREAEASFGHDEATLTGYFEDIVKNIIGEINMLYSLSGNSNIVSYQDHTVVKREDRIGWDVLIRMEYVTSLRNYLSDRQMTREEVIRLGIDLCSALELCSKKGIIHRDIKDENIFVNEDGVFKIGDFGIARELSKSGRAASMRGTPLYMAPEIFRGEKYDAAVDIYSLGIVMYKLLNNGRMPFMPPYPQTIKFRDSEDALEKRMAGQPLPLPVRSGESLGKVVLKACAYKPDNRYVSATEMKRELERVLTGMGNEEREEKVTLLNAKKESGETKPKAQPQQKADEGTVSIFGSNPSTTEKSEPKETIEEDLEAGNKTVSIFGAQKAGDEGKGEERQDEQQESSGSSNCWNNDETDKNPVMEDNYEPVYKDKNSVGRNKSGLWIFGYIAAAIIVIFSLIIFLNSNNGKVDYISSQASEAPTSTPIAIENPTDVNTGVADKTSDVTEAELLKDEMDQYKVWSKSLRALEALAAEGKYRDVIVEVGKLDGLDIPPDIKNEIMALNETCKPEAISQIFDSARKTYDGNSTNKSKDVYKQAATEFSLAISIMEQVQNKPDNMLQIYYYGGKAIALSEYPSKDEANIEATRCFNTIISLDPTSQYAYYAQLRIDEINDENR